jgi:hypothetical protein
MYSNSSDPHHTDAVGTICSTSWRSDPTRVLPFVGIVFCHLLSATDEHTDDVAGATVNVVSDRNTSETGDTLVFTITLESQPATEVTIGFESSDEGEGAVSRAAMTFVTGTWNVSQAVTVTGVDDYLVDGDVEYSIVNTAVSGDINYHNTSIADITGVRNTDGTAQSISVVIFSSVFFLLVLNCPTCNCLSDTHGFA